MLIEACCLLVAAQASGVDGRVEAVFRAIDAEEAKFAAMAKPEGKAAVIPELRHMARIDQMVRNSFDRRLAARMEEIDRTNTARLKELLKIHGWFKIGEFGKEADDLAWLLVQHADHDPAFQKAVLDTLGELYPKGETSPRHYAYLWDRVAGHTGEKQRFGTQGRCTGRNKWEPDEVEDPAHLDARRKSMGLPPMRVYKRNVRRLCP